jgi:hypothetical protein
MICVDQMRRAAADSEAWVASPGDIPNDMAVQCQSLDPRPCFSSVFLIRLSWPI